MLFLGRFSDMSSGSRILWEWVVWNWAGQRPAFMSGVCQSGPSSCMSKKKNAVDCPAIFRNRMLHMNGFFLRGTLFVWQLPDDSSTLWKEGCIRQNEPALVIMLNLLKITSFLVRALHVETEPRLLLPVSYTAHAHNAAFFVGYGMLCKKNILYAACTEEDGNSVEGLCLF